MTTSQNEPIHLSSVARRTDDGELYIANIPVAQRARLSAKTKRAFDVCSALALMAVLSPVFFLIALAIKLSSSGPVFFVQERVGLGGRIFRFYKFRSMVTNAEELKIQLQSQNEHTGPIFKIRKDPRITLIGRILRRYSLDELPQLLNVLQGDMSLVGPRPPVPKEVLEYEAWQLRRLSVVPGLTCIWQVSGRSRITFEEWMRMDLAYIDNWSLWLDLKLLVKTIKTVITADGAY